MVDPLPNELVDRIIDNFDFSIDKTTLLNCALVGRAWVRASQRGIFHTISLKIIIPPSVDTSFQLSEVIDYYVKKNHQLRALFDGNPGLASYVQCLELWDFSFGTVIQEVEGNALIIIPLSLKLSFSPSLEAALTRMFRAPSVTEVVLETLEIPKFADLVSLLSHLTRLKVLKIMAISCDDWSAPNTAHATGSPLPGSIQLDKLVFNDRDFITWFQQGSCPFGLQNLRHLQIFPAVLNSQEAVDVLQQAGKALTKLTLKRESEMGDLGPGPFLHLGYTPNLKSLKLFNIFRKRLKTPHPVDSVPWMRSLFEPLLNSDQKRYPLQRLTIEISVDGYTMSNNRYWTKWPSLDALLSKPEFDLLETVHIVIKCGSPSLDPGRRAREVLDEMLSFLKGSGKLKFTVRTSPIPTIYVHHIYQTYPSLLIDNGRLPP
ncbi:hypothetical protein BT96DRAFT_1000807 [Gymnopus androsaceus JB14]|uniref:F-box domain-containing protein n=1 Tax=Gymnopus androsaceus JB14 TaxID=1447944 RepID=A0A6A4H3I1_9AGAR|nr:hypothetical protein BT96DRAFT_1000807 [Gymnopus androsaceus JB14]